MHAAVLERINQIAEDQISKVFVPGASSTAGVPTFDPDAYVTRRDRRRMARESREAGGRRFGRRPPAAISAGSSADLSPSQTRGAQVLRGEVLTPPPGGWGSDVSSGASSGSSGRAAAGAIGGRAPRGNANAAPPSSGPIAMGGGGRGGEVALRSGSAVQRRPAPSAPSNQVGPGRKVLELEGRTRGNPNTVPPRSGSIPMGGGSPGQGLAATRSGIRGGRAALIGGGAAALGLGGAAVVRRRGAKQAAIAARRRRMAIGAGAGAAGAGALGLVASRRD